MSTDDHTFATGESTIRYREQYASEGLNKKLVGAVPWGTYRGFKLVAKGSGDRIITIEADASALDHLAVYQSATGYSLTVRKTGGDFDLDLSSYASLTIYVAIYLSYSVGATTLATVRTYTEAEFAAAPEKDEVIVLGKVDVPASGTIAAVDIYAQERRMAWQNKTSELVAWAPLLRNGDFDWLSDGGSGSEYDALYWSLNVSAGVASWKMDNTDPLVGSYHLLLDYTSGAVTSYVRQYVNVPVTAGKRFRFRFNKKAVVLASGGTFSWQLQFTDSLGADTAVMSQAIDMSAADASYEESDMILEVPAGSVHLRSIGFSTSAYIPSAGGDAIRLDDIQFWMEAEADDPYPLESRKGAELRNSIVWMDREAMTFNKAKALMDFAVDYPSSPEGQVRISRLDRARGASLAQPGLELHGRIFNLGWGLVDDSTQVLTPRIFYANQATAIEPYVLLWETDASPSGPITRGYTGSSGQPVVTQNARWTTAGWMRDDGSYDSSIQDLHDSTGLRIRMTGAASAQPWTTWDNQWFVNPFTKNMHNDDLISAWHNTTAVSNPAYATAPWANSIYAKNIVKAWGTVQTGAVPAMQDGFNMDVSGYSGSNTLIDMTFGTSMDDTAYAVVATVNRWGPLGDHFSELSGKLTSGFSAGIVDVSAVGPLDLTTVTYELMFVVLAKQTS